MAVNRRGLEMSIKDQKDTLDGQEKEIANLEKLATTFREIGRPSSDIEEMIGSLKTFTRIGRKMLSEQEDRIKTE